MKRNLTKKAKTFIYIYASIFTIIQLFVLFSYKIDARLKYVIFIGFSCSLTYLVYKISPKLDDRIRIYDIILSVISILCSLYYIYNYNDILYRSINPTNLDIIFGCLTILLVIEACRRTIGLILPIISVIALLYAFYGEKLPGIWGHRHYSLSRIINILYMTDNGIYGSITKVAATTVFAFTVMGVYFKRTSIGNILTNFITSLTQKYHGGAALVSVISSGLFGMISGSAASNVVTTGQFTIPMMKKEGFEPEYAAAIESVSSAGGTLTPPVLGAAVFIMMEILQISYNNIVKATIIPAIIYFFSILFMVYFTARKKNIKGKNSDLRTMEIVKDNWVIIIPIALLFIMVLSGIPLIHTALLSTIAMIFLACFNKKMQVSKKDLINGIGDVGISCLPTSMACVCSGIIIGIINLTGISVRFSEIIIRLSGINIIFALFATMIMLIVLGMGLPAVASYIIGASIAAPVLISIGIPDIAAHLFIFYFSCLSSITPPVALNAYLASGIASANPIKTAFLGCLLCLPVFAVPYMFIYQPEIMLQENFLKSILIMFDCIIGTLCTSIGLVGFFKDNLNIVLRILLVLSGILFLDTNILTDIIGLFIIVIILSNKKLYKKIV